MAIVQQHDVRELSTPLLAAAALYADDLIRSGRCEDEERMSERRQQFLEELIRRGKLDSYTFRE